MIDCNRIKNGKTLTDGSRIKIDSVKEEENEVKVSLKLNEAEMSDAGQYTVIARNSEGEATNSATLTVIGKHSIYIKCLGLAHTCKLMT